MTHVPSSSGSDDLADQQISAAVSQLIALLARQTAQELMAETTATEETANGDDDREED